VRGAHLTGPRKSGSGERSACVDERHVVGRDAAVCCDDRQALGTRLRDEQSVERITMMCGQLCDRQSLIGVQAQNPNAASARVLTKVALSRRSSKDGC